MKTFKVLSIDAWDAPRRPQRCNCDQAIDAEATVLSCAARLELCSEALLAIKAALTTNEPHWDDSRRIRWVGSIVALAEANLGRLK